MQLARFSSVHTFSITAFIEPAVPTPFVITTEGLTGAIAHGLGIEDVEVGDPEFDKAFRLVSKDAEALKRLVNPEVQAVLKELATVTAGFGSHFRVTDQVVWLQQSNLGLMTEEETLRDLPVVIRVVKAIKAAAAAPS